VGISSISLCIPLGRGVIYGCRKEHSGWLVHRGSGPLVFPLLWKCLGLKYPQEGKLCCRLWWVWETKEGPHAFGNGGS